MAVKPEAFLALEQALSNRIVNAWKADQHSELQSIAKLIDDGKFVEATAKASTIDIGPAVRKNEKFVRFIGMSAILFGATKFSHASKTSFARKSRPPILDKAVTIFIRTMIENGNLQIHRKMQNLIHDAEQDYKPIGSEKSETQVKKASFSKPFVPSVVSEGKRMADLGASLHTSRLANWGYLTEAELEGSDTYEVSEVLDSATCPVCQLMDGKVFTVERAKQRVEMLLNVENPDDLKQLAPWPDQDEDSLDDLRKLSDGELVDRGLDMPPYHPNCRGILQKTNSESTVTVLNPAIQPNPEPSPVTEDLVVEQLKQTYLEKLRQAFGIGAADTGLNDLLGS